MTAEVPPDMCIVQITDIHRGEEGRFAAGVDVDGNYRETTDAVRSIDPDILVCTGDLVCTQKSRSEAEEMIAEWRDMCEALYVVPGNHDDVPTLRTCLRRALGKRPEWPSVVVADGLRMLLLDTSGGMVDVDGRRALQENAVLANKRGERYLIFMHHPPFVTGCAGLDAAVGMVDVAETSATLSLLESEYRVFCGHFHMEGASSVGHGMVYQTAAVSFQVPCDATGFAISSDRPCLRTIHTDKTGITTEHICLR